MDEKKSSIVAITDTNFVIAVYLLICSIRKLGISSNIYVLGDNLSPEETLLLNQFDQVQVCPADQTNQRNPTTRKGEAILLAAQDDSDYITLLDGDCLVTGDITQYLAPEKSGLYVRIRPPEEDGAVYFNRYRKGDVYGTIPAHILDTWRKDVGENTIPAIKNTVLGGNLTISKQYIGFAQKWQDQMLKILPEKRTKTASDRMSTAYFQLDESVLNSLLAFSNDAPPVFRGCLDADSSAYVAHLGPCDPKPWILWRKERLRYYPLVLDLLEWARKSGYQLPQIPWSFKKKNKPVIYVVAYVFSYYLSLRGKAGKFLKALKAKI